MAFEIYNGTGTGFEALAKMNEMWDFDTYDDSGSEHIATYGNVKIKVDGSFMYFGTTSDVQLKNMRFETQNFKIIKAANAIMLFWIYSGSTPMVIVLGTATDSNGTAGKGGLCRPGGVGTPTYCILSERQTDMPLTANTTIFQSDSITQLVPLSSNKAGSYTFDNVYMLYLTTMPTNTVSNISGLYQIGEDNYYLSNCIAIKEG